MKLLFSFTTSVFFGFTAFAAIDSLPLVSWFVVGIAGVISGLLSARAFYNDLRGIGLSYWSVTTTDRRILFLVLAAICGIYNYAALAVTSSFLTEFWLSLVFGVSVIIPAAVLGRFFERIHSKYCALCARKANK